MERERTLGVCVSTINKKSSCRWIYQRTLIRQASLGDGEGVGAGGGAGDGDIVNDIDIDIRSLRFRNARIDWLNGSSFCNSFAVSSIGST